MLSSNSLYNEKEIIPEVTPKELSELDKEILGQFENKSEAEIKKDLEILRQSSVPFVIPDKAEQLLK